MKVVFIPKAGKSDYAIAKAYRPITLSNFMLKGLERIIQWFILEYFIPEPLYQQHAYTKGRSCDTALSAFVHDIERAILQKQYLLAVSLDCSGAFDCIRFDSAERGMRKKHIPENIIRWYMNLLKGRIVDANIQGVTASIKPRRGSPQGGVLSPLVWNLIMDELLSSFRIGPVRVIGYADDILVYVIGKAPITLGEILQPMLDKVILWGKKNGLTFNPQKTSAMLFTRNKQNYEYPTLHMEGVALELVSSFKYLGVEIQRHLSWTKHVQERSNKCKSLLARCRNLISQKWGLTPHKMEWVYKMIVRPKITYGAVVWAAHINKSNRNRLEKVQRLAALSVSQPLRSAPTAGLENMMGWIPLHLHAQSVGLCAYNRISKQSMTVRWDGHGSKPRSLGHLGLWSRELQSILPKNFPMEDRKQHLIWGKESKSSSRPSQTVRIYTDASKKGNRVGYGFCACIGDTIIAETFFSAWGIGVHRAELISIGEALSWIKESNSENCHFHIQSDSQSAVSILCGHKATDDTTRHILTLLWEVREYHRVDVTWVRGHDNVTGNEYADYLANQGANMAMNLSFCEPYTPITYDQAKKLIIKSFIQKWQNEWNDRMDCRISKLFMPLVSTERKNSLMSTKELQQLSQIVTGHGLYKRHLRHWNEIEDYSCSLCLEEYEDTWHIWNLCPCLSKDRYVALSTAQNGRPLERVLLTFFQSKRIKELVASNETLLLP